MNSKGTPVASVKWSVIRLMLLLLLTTNHSPLTTGLQGQVSTNKVFVVGTNNVLPPNEANFFQINSNLLNAAVAPSSGSGGGITSGGTITNVSIIAPTNNSLCASNVTSVGGQFAGNAAGLTNIPAAQLTGTLPMATLPAAVVTNNDLSTLTFGNGLILRNIGGAAQAVYGDALGDDIAYFHANSGSNASFDTTGNLILRGGAFIGSNAWLAATNGMNWGIVSNGLSVLGGLILWGTNNVTNNLPAASTTVLGAVKVDGSSITINGSGVISASGGGGMSSNPPAFFTNIAAPPMMGAGGTNLWFNAGATNYFEVNLTNAASFLNGPTNALYDRELVTLEFIQDATGNRTILYNTGQSSGNIVPTTSAPGINLSTNAGYHDFVLLRYNLAHQNWILMGNNWGANP